MKWQRILVGVLMLGLLLALGPGPQAIGTSYALPLAQATGGATIPYPGRLSDAAGQAVADGAYDLMFTLYDAETGGQQVWAETQPGVAVRGGSFTALLGSVNSIPKEVMEDKGLWLAVAVRGPGESEFTALAPRQMLTANGLQAPSALTCPHSHFGDSWSGSVSGFGLNVTNNGTGDAIRAYSSSTSNGYAAIWAVNRATTGYGTAVYANSTKGLGLYAYSGAGDAIEAVTDAAPGKSAIFAHSVNGNGVWAFSTNGQALHGASTNNFGLAAVGSDSSLGDLLGDVQLDGNYGEIFAFGSKMDLYGNGDVIVDLDNDNNGSNNYFKIVNGQDSPAFTVDESGNTTAAGAKSAVVQTAHYGQRLLYSVESSEVWFEDIGRATLVDGVASISFDPIFAESVNFKETYHVFVTPLCQEPVLAYVTEQTESGFTVRGVTLKEEPSNCAFDYRVVAKRLGYENTRLAPVDASNVEGK
jgi:hypothetical protein